MTRLRNKETAAGPLRRQKRRGTDRPLLCPAVFVGRCAAPPALLDAVGQQGRAAESHWTAGRCSFSIKEQPFPGCSVNSGQALEQSSAPVKRNKLYLIAKVREDPNDQLFK